jgi:hypothetical protein
MSGQLDEAPPSTNSNTALNWRSRTSPPNCAVSWTPTGMRCESKPARIHYYKEKRRSLLIIPQE